MDEGDPDKEPTDKGTREEVESEGRENAVWGNKEGDHEGKELKRGDHDHRWRQQERTRRKKSREYERRGQYKDGHLWADDKSWSK